MEKLCNQKPFEELLNVLSIVTAALIVTMETSKMLHEKK